MMARRGLLREHSSALVATLYALDWAVIATTAIAAYRIYLHSWAMPGPSVFVVGTAILLAAIIFPKLHLYRAWRGAALFDEVRALTLAWVAVLSFLFAFAFVTKMGAVFSRGWIVSWALLGWCALVIERPFIRLVLRMLRRRGFNQRQIVIVGTGELGKDLARRLAKSPWAGLQVAGFFVADDELPGATIEGRAVLGRLADLPSYVEREGIDQVWITLALRDEDKVRQIQHGLRHSTADIRFVPDIFGFRLLNHSVTEVAGLPVLNLSTTPMTGLNRMMKALEDRLLALLILMLVSPLMLVIAIGVKLSSPGPIFYRQERVGWAGQPFMMLKFRSMPTDAEHGTGPVWARSGEKRATPFGAFLRRTSLDELPQFINVLKGEMSIVGPRPERPVFVDKFKDEIPDYMKKHLVKAGITGWAQVNGWRGDTDLSKRIEYDLFYIENWSLWFDLKIIFLTLFKGLMNKNAY